MFLKMQAEIFFESKLQLFRRARQRLFNLQPTAVSRCVCVCLCVRLHGGDGKSSRTLIKGLLQSSGDYKAVFAIVSLK